MASYTAMEDAEEIYEWGYSEEVARSSTLTIRDLRSAKYTSSSTATENVEKIDIDSKVACTDPDTTTDIIGGDQELLTRE